MTTTRELTRFPDSMLRHVRVPKRPLRAALAAVVLALPAALPARAQGFLAGPAHGPNGLGTSYGQCATSWDADGAGPNPPLLVVADANSSVKVWNGSRFIAFGGIPKGAFRSLGVYNGQLYVGGTFTGIGSDVVNNVARWDGAHWQPLGSGMTGAGNPGNPTGSVNSLVVHSGVLCIGGTFVPASTGSWTSFATWDGTTLTAGLATQAPISQLAEIGGQLFAATTVTVPGVYRYDTSTWTRFGTLADQSILTLTSYNGDLVCGGDFTHFFTGVPIYGAARWNGSQWVPMGGGLGPAGCEVASLASWNGVLVAAGKFSTAGGAVVNDAAQWDGTAWSGMAGGFHLANGGLNGGLRALMPFAGELDAMGAVDAAAGLPAQGIARWNGVTWLPFIAGINAPVRALLAAGTTLDAGGDFQFDWGAGTLQRGFATDGSSVSALGAPGAPNGANGELRAFTLHTFNPLNGADLIAGGSFSQAGGLGASNVAACSPLSGWEPLAGGFDDVVTALVDFRGTLYAAGYFAASGTTSLPHLARYGGTGWADPGFGSFLTLYALAELDNQLVIGGVAGSGLVRPANGVSAWTGKTLVNYGGANGPVYALASLNGDIVAAGAFTSIGGAPAAGVAIRSSSTGAWSAMGGGFPLGVPYALAVYDGRLYAGGTITGSIQTWNGSSWVALAGGLDGPVYALASFGTDLAIGGDFQESSTGVQSPYLIRWNDGVLAADPGPPAPGIALGRGWPNPARGGSRIEFSLEHAGRARLAILDLAGRRVRALADGWFEPGLHAAEWDGFDAQGHPSPAGVYFYALEADGSSAARRIVLTR